MRASSVVWCPLALLAVAAASPAMAGDVAPRSVVVRSIMDNDKAIAPGGALARIGGLRKGGDGFVSVRAAPTVTAAETGRLTQDTVVIAVLPEEWGRADFVGVIYEPGTPPDVSLMSRCKLPDVQPYFEGAYTGPCRSGWVSRRFVTVLAD